MKTNGGSPKTYNDMNCIWMSTELVSYKLCDKEFDCENCEFDKVIRNLSAKVTDSEKNVEKQNGNILEKLIKRIESENFNNNLIYLNDQIVIKNFFGDVYYLGINPLVLLLLDEFSFIHEFNNKEIKKDQIIFTLEGSWGIKQFVSPANFTIIEKINFSHFKLNRWYSIILINNSIEENFRLTEDAWNIQKNNIISFLRERMIKTPLIGQSMNDGGEKINFLHQYLGREEYLKLLNQVYK